MIGTEIASYRILEKLGEGGMGVVYKGIDTSLDRLVAIKVLSSSLSGNPELVQRFRAEAKAQANLNHTNLATLYAFVVQDGSASMVMEFVDGETFDNMIQRRGPIPAAEAIPLFKQALLGIGYAHRAGIVHRDIKPSNLMVNRLGIVKVMDFGIAKVMGVRGMTKTGTQMGTGWYMSPEQVLNKSVDIRSDIYSLGVTLYQMLSANVPFDEDSEFAIMNAHIQTPPPPPTRYYPYIPKGIENAVLKALEKNPNNRFQTVEEFGAALERPEDFAFASAAAAPQQAAPRPVAPAAMDRTVTMMAAPAAAATSAPTVTSTTFLAQPPMVTPPPQAQPPAENVSRPLLPTPRSKMIAAGVGLAAVLLVGWLSLPSKDPNAGKTVPATPARSSTPTPLEQHLATPSPAVEMVASTATTPKVVSFGSVAGVIPAGQSAHLSWSVSGASQVTITPGVGTVKPEGGVNIPLQKTTEFVLVAKNEKGESATSTVTVVVQPPNSTPAPPAKVADRAPADVPAVKETPPPAPVRVPPPPTHVMPGIVFDAVPGAIPAGGTAVLRWSLTNAQSASIQPAPGALHQTAGQYVVRPTETTVYTLTATSPDGTSAGSTLTVRVQPAVQSAVPPPAPPAARPGVNIAMVVHDHGVAFGQNNAWPRCWGQLQVVGNHLQYRVMGTADGRRDDFDVQLSQVQEASANRMPIRNQPAFHLTIAGQHLNFVPQGTTTGVAVAAIQFAMHQ
jgi:hypothetical protein